MREHNVPVNRLHAEGFPSVGCAPCTRAVKPGDDPRSGRWWWENADTRECGLHVDEEKDGLGHLSGSAHGDHAPRADPARRRGARWRWPGRARSRAALAPDVTGLLERSAFVYVSPLKSDGAESRCHGEVWYGWLDGAWC